MSSNSFFTDGDTFVPESPDEATLCSVDIVTHGAPVLLNAATVVFTLGGPPEGTTMYFIGRLTRDGSDFSPQNAAALLKANQYPLVITNYDTPPGGSHTYSLVMTRFPTDGSSLQSASCRITAVELGG